MPTRPHLPISSPASIWRRDLGDARLSHELGVRHIEAMYLCGRFEEAERLAEALLERTELPLDKAAVLEQLVLAHTTQLRIPQGTRHRRARARAAGRARPGAPRHGAGDGRAGAHQACPGRPAHRQACGRCRAWSIERKLAAMRILMLATAPAYFEDQNLLPLVSLRMVRLSVRYGNAAHSAFGYVMYGMVLCGVLNDMRRGLAFGRLALDAVDLFDARDIHGRVSMVFGGFILHWNGRLADTLPYFADGANAALEAGDLEFHGYNRYAYASYAFMSGMPLDKVADMLEAGYGAVLQHKHEKTQRVFRMARQAVRELRGRAAAPGEPRRSAVRRGGRSRLLDRARPHGACLLLRVPAAEAVHGARLRGLRARALA